MYIRNFFIIGSIALLLVAIMSGTSLGAPATTTASAAKTPAATTKTTTPAKATVPVTTTGNLATISSVTSSGNNLIIKADATIKPTVKVLSSPDRIVIDIPNTQLSMKLLKATSAVNPFGNVSGVRTATNFGVNPSTRLVVDLTAPTKYTIKSAGNTFTLNLGMAAATTTTKPQEPVAITSAVTPSALIDQPKPVAVASPAQNAVKPIDIVKPASKAVLQEPTNEPVVEVIKPANTTAVIVPDNSIKPINNKIAQSSGNPDVKSIAFGENYSDENPLVTINAKDADIKDMLQMFADRANLNLIMDKSVAGNISLSINNMPFNDALNVLLKLNDLSAKKIGNTLVVAATAEFLKKDFEAPVAKSIKLNNAQASVVAGIIKSSLPATSKANIVVDERTSSILITGSQYDVDKAEAIVAAVDTKTKQVLIEVKLIDLADSGTEALGTKFGGGLGGNGTGVGQFNNPGLPFPTSTAGVGGINLTYNSAGGLPTSFFAQLDMLVKTNKAKVLASPIVATQENIPALVDITDKIVTGVTTQTTAGVGTTTTITTEEVGMKVELTPKISYDGSITMQVHPMLTAKGDQLNPGQGGQPIYSKVKREANTTLRVKDGETIVIAGLKQTQNSTSVAKVPFLGDLPWLGSLFSSTQTDKKVSDILILVTPHLVSDMTPDIASTGKKPEYIPGILIK